MIKTLTIKEHMFMTELCTLVEKYDVYFSVDGNKGINIVVCVDEVLPEIPPIYFKESFDENEIRDLLKESQKHAERLSAYYQKGIEPTK